MSNTPRILDLEIELPLVSNSIIVDEKIAEHNADAEAHPYILGVLEEKANSADLADVATSGDYDDLENKPDIEDIAANAASRAVSTHNESEDAHTDIRNEIGTVKDIAEGANIAIVFNSYSELVSFFNTESDSLKVGTNLYVKTVEVPDLWISAVESTSVSYTYTTDEDFLAYINSNGQIGYYKFSELETQKVDLSNYATLTDLSGKVSKSGDTMSGGLLFDVSSANKWIGAQRASNSNITRDCIYWASSGGSTYFGQMNSDYTGIQTTFARMNSVSGLIMAGTRGVFENNSTTTENRLQRYDKIFTTGITSDTKTWSTDADGKYSYVISDPVSGPIPNSFITEWNVKCSLYSYQGAGKFNANTGYFECNGLTDITYEEAIIILYESSMPSMQQTSYRRSRTNLGVAMNSASLARQWQSSNNEIAYGANTSWNLGSGTTSSTTFNPCQRLRKIIYWRFSYIQGTFAPGGTSENNSLPSLEIIEVSGSTYGPVGNIDLRPATNFTLAGVVELVSKAQGNNSITFRFATKTYQACQADTHQYTWNGQIYVGVLSYAAAKNITIMN